MIHSTILGCRGCVLLLGHKQITILKKTPLVGCLIIKKTVSHRRPNYNDKKACLRHPYTLSGTEYFFLLPQNTTVFFCEVCGGMFPPPLRQCTQQHSEHTTVQVQGEPTSCGMASRSPMTELWSKASEPHVSKYHDWWKLRRNYMTNKKKTHFLP